MEDLNDQNDSQSKIIQLDYTQIPLRVLKVSSRRLLSKALIRELPLLTANGVPRDWQGLCELAEMSYNMIKFYKNCSDPVNEMIEFWCTYRPCPSIAELINHLKLMERFDVIDDIKEFIDRDSRAYMNSLERNLWAMDNSQTSMNSLERNQWATDTFSAGILQEECITVDDVLEQESASESGGTRVKYDAYISYVDDDEDFVAAMRVELEENFKLKLFIRNRDLLPGIVRSEADLHLINDRCEKILLIVSQSSINDPHCEWQAIVAQTSAIENSGHSRKIIPIVCKPCSVPVRYKHLTRLDFTKKDTFGSFWRRLYSAIRNQRYYGFTGCGSTYSIREINDCNSLLTKPNNASFLPSPNAQNLVSLLSQQNNKCTNMNIPVVSSTISRPKTPEVTNINNCANIEETSSEITDQSNRSRSPTPERLNPDLVSEATSTTPISTITQTKSRRKVSITKFISKMSNWQPTKRCKTSLTTN